MAILFYLLCVESMRVMIHKDHVTSPDLDRKETA